MKKVTLFAAAVALIGMASCSKDYDCTCSGDYEIDLGVGMNMPGTIPAETYTIEDTDEDEAKSECQEREDQIRSEYFGDAFDEVSEININCSVSEAD